MTTNYTLKRSGVYNFYLGACVFAVIAMPICYMIKPMAILSACLLLAFFIFGAYQMYIQQQYIALEGKMLTVMRKHKERTVASYDLNKVDKVLFDPFGQCYRIGIKRGREVTTYELTLVGKTQAARLIRDLQTLGVLTITRK